MDLTALVKYWVETPCSYHGVYLREESGVGTAVFKSSESSYLDAPFLAIQTTQNEIKTFDVTKDTFLTATTVRSLGHENEFQVGPGRPALLAFNDQFLELDSSAITKASLYLSTTDRQYDQAQISVYAIAPISIPGAVEIWFSVELSSRPRLGKSPRCDYYRTV